MKKLIIPWRVMDEVVGDNHAWTTAGMAMTGIGLLIATVGLVVTVDSKFVFRIPEDAHEFTNAILS